MQRHRFFPYSVFQEISGRANNAHIILLAKNGESSPSKSSISEGVLNHTCIDLKLTLL